jgi:hypothetical protein
MSARLKKQKSGRNGTLGIFFVLAMLRPDFEHPKKVSDDLAINPELEKH